MTSSSSTDINHQMQQQQQSSATDRGLKQMNVASWLFYVGVAAAIKTSVLHPLTVAMARKRVLEEHASLFTVLFRPETISKQQKSSSTSSSSSSSTCCHKGMLDSLKKASTQQRIRFIYRGFGVACIANVFGEVVYFGILEYVRFLLEGGNFDGLRNSIGGAGAELVALTTCTPLSVICHRQMTSGFGVASDIKYGPMMSTFKDVITPSSSSSSAAGDAKSIIKNDYKRLFAGLSVALTALPAAAIWWGLYTSTKEGLYSIARNQQQQQSLAIDNGEGILGSSITSTGETSSSSSSSSYFLAISSSRDNPLINGASGITAAVLTTILFNPFNVVRTRMQSGSQQNKSALKIASLMLKNEGPRSFMKGVVVSSGSAALEGSILSSVYEYTKWLSDHTVWNNKK